MTLPTNKVVSDTGHTTDHNAIATQVNANTLAIATAASGLPQVIVSKTANYTAAVGEFVEADTTAGAFTVTLPTNPAVGALVSVKRISGDANVLTILPAGGGTIDGDATATTSTQWAGAVFEHKGSNVWRISASMTTTGPQGPQGAAGSIAVGTTSTLSPGASATVTNSGSTTAAVFNFGIPQGAVGPAGGWQPTLTATKTSAYAPLDGEIVVCDATGGGFTVTLPTPTAARRIGVRKIDSSANVVTVATASGLVDGAATRTFAAQWQTQVYIADGTNWHRLDVPGVTGIAASGTPSSSTYLRGDGTWSSVAGLVPPFATKSGFYITAPEVAAYGAGSQIGFGVMGAHPILIPNSCTISALGINVGVLSATGTIRAGIYADDGTMRPGTLVVDGGSISCTATGYFETAAFSQALSAGIYWLATVQQGSGTLPQGFGTQHTIPVPAPSANMLTNKVYGVIGGSGVTAGLPTPFPAVASYANNANATSTVHRVLAKVA